MPQEDFIIRQVKTGKPGQRRPVPNLWRGSVPAPGQDNPIHREGASYEEVEELLLEVERDIVAGRPVEVSRGQFLGSDEDVSVEQDWMLREGAEHRVSPFERATFIVEHGDDWAAVMRLGTKEVVFFGKTKLEATQRMTDWCRVHLSSVTEAQVALLAQAEKEHLAAMCLKLQDYVRQARLVWDQIANDSNTAPSILRTIQEFHQWHPLPAEMGSSLEQEEYEQ